MPSVAYSHGAIPAEGTSVASVVPLRQGTYNFDEGNTRLAHLSPRPWSEFDEGNALTAPFPSATV